MRWNPATTNNSKTCSIDGCGKRGRGNANGVIVCGAHYQRWKILGQFELPEREKTRQQLTCAHCGIKFFKGYLLTRKRLAKPIYCTPKCFSDGMATRAHLNVEKRFWKYVKKGRKNECWLWTGQISSKGYGCFNWQHRDITLAHRASYKINKGIWAPKGISVCHTCDNPPCVNPDHLWLGTQKDNMQDCARKGRTSRTPKRWGEQINSAKLTAKDVIKIRASMERGVVLAKKYGVSAVQINNIKIRKHWKHVG